MIIIDQPIKTEEATVSVVALSTSATIAAQEVGEKTNSEVQPPEGNRTTLRKTDDSV